jgi:hypothetical protein
MTERHLGRTESFKTRSCGIQFSARPQGRTRDTLASFESRNSPKATVGERINTLKRGTRPATHLSFASCRKVAIFDSICKRGE